MKDAQGHGSNLRDWPYLGIGALAGANAKILRLNAYGARWHVMIDGKGVVFSGTTKASCRAYCRRHGHAVGG
jgi:hypothetical protein